MGFWKFPPFLVLGILVLYQAGMYHAAPLRSVFDGRFDPATLDEEESRLLLSAMVNDYEQMRARESEKAQKTEGSRPFLFLYPENQHPEESLQHCHLHDPSPGRLAEQIWEYGEEQLVADQDGFQDLQWAPQELLVLSSEMILRIRSPGS
ncbi:calcitonin receptor-stimulating peptide 1 isoform X2 [Cervus elaphus]|uniref:calcitonin receptor-stimulating peptide 1 isoform X2 n=1 Tax=Cervus canadensis TaxID=1574408 RepID=UPI001C9E9244|nr:calcitonin receptor-stimulating peptide 1 isoform X2 [Cervus canadensis]XP_043758404.1 calcitonin receptor-stimulating peptide 1 isoform X2 [Cervus elaphus]